MPRPECNAANVNNTFLCNKCVAYESLRGGTDYAWVSINNDNKCVRCRVKDGVAAITNIERTCMICSTIDSGRRTGSGLPLKQAKWTQIATDPFHPCQECVPDKGWTHLCPDMDCIRGECTPRCNPKPIDGCEKCFQDHPRKAPRIINLCGTNEGCMNIQTNHLGDQSGTCTCTLVNFVAENHNPGIGFTQCPKNKPTVRNIVDWLGETSGCECYCDLDEKPNPKCDPETQRYIEGECRCEYLAVPQVAVDLIP